MSATTFFKDLAPPCLWRFLGRLSGRVIAFGGKPTSWRDAVRMSSGYTQDVILERVLAATREVVAGRASYERDSMLFHQPSFPFPILATLLRSALQNDGRLDVIDLGGSLGSTYRQCRPFLGPVAHMRWQVIEQPSFVAVGRKEFQTAELGFYESIAELPSAPVPRVILALSVLQYLERPADVLAELTRVGASAMVIDRTPLSEASESYLCLQRVPRHIYPATYPCWIFSRAGLLGRLALHWRLLCEFPCPEGSHIARGSGPFAFRGLVLERKP